MTRWTKQRVLETAAAWVWVPGDALDVIGDGYRIVRYPDRLLGPGSPAARVLWSRTARPLAVMIDEIIAQVRTWGLDEVHWRVSDATEPATTERELRARGAELSETFKVLGFDLSEGLPLLDPPADVTAELVDTERTLQAESHVNVHGWGEKAPDEADLARQLDEAIRELRNWSSFRVVAFADAGPISAGGCTLDGEVAKLWGAVTLAQARGRGGYRAVLAERLRLARDHGASLALVKGSTQTSGPILLRAGFTDFGEERLYRLQAH
jgi:hypothetical protein